MKSPLVINIRCTCIEEYINIQKLHKEYMRQSKEGEITSLYVGAEFAVPGEFEAVDALIAKRGPRQIPCVDFGNRPIVSERITGAQGNGDGTVTETVERVVVPQVTDIRSITKKFTKEDFEELKKEIYKGAVVVSGSDADEAKELPQAVDGGVDAMGNQPLPENPLTLDEARAIGTGYAEREEELPCVEEPVPTSLFHGPAAETEVHKSFLHVPESVDPDEDVPAYVGTEPFSTFGPQEFNQATPSVAEESDDGWNGEDHNYTC